MFTWFAGFYFENYQTLLHCSRVDFPSGPLWAAEFDTLWTRAPSEIDTVHVFNMSFWDAPGGNQTID